MKNLLTILMLCCWFSVFAQTGIGTTTPNALAQLDVSSSTKGFLPPRVALTSTSSASPLAAHVAGMVVFNTATAGDVTPGLYVNNGSVWETTAAGVTPGTTAGDMQYWNGTAWVVVAATANEAATLQMISGVPTWVPPSVTNPTTGKIWMDRNLGASQVATSSTDAASYGDLYQWGRGTDGHQIRTSGTTTTLSSTDVPGHGDFIMGSTDWRSGQNVNLWQGTAGTNNPCPTGYRLPTEAEFTAEIASWSPNNNAAGAFASPLKFTVAGTRGSGSGGLDGEGSSGYYWSSTIAATKTWRLVFGSAVSISNDGPRAGGYSVRCIKD